MIPHRGLGDYTSVTEKPGLWTTEEALRMLATRYSVAADLGRGRDVLEVGCAAGIGLGWLARGARRVVGADITAALLGQAKYQYGDKIALVRLDAEMLPFDAGTFDVILLCEAIYYLHSPSVFVAEARRLLRSGGQLLITSANCEWTGFNPSPLSTRYWTASELDRLLTNAGFQVQVAGAFWDGAAGSFSARLLRLVRRLAVRFGVIPKSMKGKETLKRMFWKLEELPAELHEGDAVAASLLPLDDETGGAKFRILYAIGTIPAEARVASISGSSEDD